jgi:hypothetical protein
MGIPPEGRKEVQSAAATERIEKRARRRDGSMMLCLRAMVVTGSTILLCRTGAIYPTRTLSGSSSVYLRLLHRTLNHHTLSTSLQSCLMNQA